MADRVHAILLAAIGAARYGVAPEPAIANVITSDDRTMRLDRLGFDSLAWMEFCISIELQCGQELTPADIERMRYVFEIEEWLRARLQ
jgi:acyl carrier protein